MSRYIDSESFYKRADIIDAFLDKTELNTKEIRDFLDDVPTADVAPVVRCKDCKYYHSVASHCGNCTNTTTIQHPNDFCSRGRRKEDEQIH